ncbi:hypothetical protein GDV60_08320 [Pseudomonas sp. DTU12.1]|nr:hypothetical protein GDV60_08320 [Pseudomonas sp. DTU12.1]
MNTSVNLCPLKWSCHRSMWEPGLPAMQAPRCAWQTESMRSQASQLPHKPAPTRDQVMACGYAASR